MTRVILFLTPFLLLNMKSDLHAQQQTEFPIGVFGGNDFSFIQMDTSLNLTWVLGYGGVGSGGGPFAHYPIETNSANLKVITMRNNIFIYGTGQRLEIEAEADGMTGTEAYFQRILTPKTGGPTDPLEAPRGRRGVVGTDQPGYLISDVWPDNQYAYNRTNYTATFRMKITKASPSTDSVALLSVVCVTAGQGGAHPLAARTLGR